MAFCFQHMITSEMVQARKVLTKKDSTPWIWQACPVWHINRYIPSSQRSIDELCLKPCIIYYILDPQPQGNSLWLNSSGQTWGVTSLTGLDLASTAKGRGCINIVMCSLATSAYQMQISVISTLTFLDSGPSVLNIYLHSYLYWLFSFIGLMLYL